MVSTVALPGVWTPARPRLWLPDPGRVFVAPRWLRRARADTVVQAVTVPNYTAASNASAVSGSITIPSTGAGNALVVLLTEAAASTATVGTISATGASFVNPASTSSTNPPANFATGVNSYIQMSYALNISSGITSVAYNIGATARITTIAVYELAGVAAASAVDASNSASGAAGTAQVDPSLTPTVSGDIYIGGICVPSGALTLNQAGSTPTSGWTGQTQLAPANHTADNGYQILSSTAAAQLAWTLNVSGAAGLVAMLFLAATAAGPRPRAVLPRLAAVHASGR